MSQCNKIAMVVTLIVVAASIAFADIGLYVSPDGDDAQYDGLAPEAGKEHGPFASLQRARDEVRRLKESDREVGAVTIMVRGGRYFLDEPLKLTEKESGTGADPVIWRAYRDEKPVLVGGRKVTGFKPSKQGIMKCDLKKLGFDKPAFRDLYFNGERQHLARFPNFNPERPYSGGFSYVAGEPVPQYANRQNEKKNILHYKKGDIDPDWEGIEEAEILVFPRHNWWNNIIEIKSVDADKRIVKLEKNASYAIRPGDRYFARNIFEELDAPGEWYLDKQEGVLYFWPPQKIEGSQVLVPTMDRLIVLEGARHVTVRGFEMKVVGETAVHLSDCHNCLIADNKVHNTGGFRVSAISASGKNCRVTGNNVHHVGSAGISVRGGDRETLEAGNNSADNNYVHHTGFYYKQGVGMGAHGVGNRLAHNLIHDCPRWGISFGGNEHTIEYNHIRHVNTETSDTGGIYCWAGRDITRRGTVIRYNFLHDILGFGKKGGKWVSPYYAWGIYIDGGHSGVKVYGNICARVPLGGGHVHGGFDNIWRNNIFIDGRRRQMWVNCWGTNSNRVKHMRKSADRKADNAAYQKRYPKLFEDKKGKTGNKFVRNIMYYHEPNARLYRHRNYGSDFECDYNLVYHCGEPILLGMKNVSPDEQWQAWQEKGFDVHSKIADPRFKDPQASDYRLKKDSPAWDLGFQRIPIEKIGPYKSPFRRSWPIEEAEGVREHPIKAPPLPAPKPPKYTPVGKRIPRKGTPKCRAVGVKKALTIDGEIAKNEWGGKAYPIQQSVGRRKILGPASQMWLAHDEGNLYVAVRVHTEDTDKLTTGRQWAVDDGFEVCFQKPGNGKEGPIYIVQSFYGGHCQSVTSAGAPRKKARTLQKGLEHASGSGDQYWCGEVKIPLSRVNISPEKGVKLRFNVGIRRARTQEWIIWQGTGAQTWKVEKAGVLKFQ